MFTALGEATAWANPEIVALGAQKVNALIAADPVLKQIRVRPARHAAAGAAHPVVGRGATARVRRHAARRPAGHSRPARRRPTFRGRRSSSATARKSGSTTRAIRSPATRRTAPTASWSSTSSGPATRRSRTRSARRSRQRSKGDLFRAKARHYDSALQAALDGANIPEAVYRSLIAETNRGPAGAAPLFRAPPADARACPTWAIGTFIRRW